MRSFHLWLFMSVTLLLLVAATEARGGRRGGSFGGIFGGWRKYRKHSSSRGGSSRRVINGSPMHTTITKSAAHQNRITPKRSSPDSHRRQDVPYDFQRPYHQLPPGGSYYANTAAIPANAIYYTQPPTQGPFPGGDFFMGYLTGRLMTINHNQYRHQNEHVYQHNPAVTENETGKTADDRVIVINNPTAEKPDSTTDSTKPWPLDGNKTVAGSDAGPTLLQPASQPPTQHDVGANKKTDASAPYGIICVPIWFNETNPDEPTVMRQVKKLVCYPAPPPQPQPQQVPGTSSPDTRYSDVNCVIHAVSEADPNDATKSITALRKVCPTAATTTPAPPRQVAGDITDFGNAELVEDSSFAQKELH